MGAAVPEPSGITIAAVARGPPFVVPLRDIVNVALDESELVFKETQIVLVQAEHPLPRHAALGNTGHHSLRHAPKGCRSGGLLPP